MSRMLAICIAVLLAAIGTVRGEVQPKDDNLIVFPNPLNAVFGECGDPCTIKESLGGNMYQFIAAAEYLLYTGRKAKIIGDCFSACVLFADKGRPNVCIEPTARFHFHQGKQWLYNAIFPDYMTHMLPNAPGKMLALHFYITFEPPHSPDIDAWVYRHGRYPFESFLTMSSSHASQFWQMCGGPPHPRPRPPQ